MNTYMVKKINLTNVKTADDYFKAMSNAVVKYCVGLREVEDYCGGKLRREYNGYSGINGNTEYIATRV